MLCTFVQDCLIEYKVHKKQLLFQIEGFCNIYTQPLVFFFPYYEIWLRVCVCLLWCFTGWSEWSSHRSGLRVLRLPGEKLRVTKNIFEIRGSKRPDWAWRQRATHTHTHTQTHTLTLCFHVLWGLLIDIMIFILYKLYIMSPYTNLTPKPTHHTH